MTDGDVFEVLKNLSTGESPGRCRGSVKSTRECTGSWEALSSERDISLASQSALSQVVDCESNSVERPEAVGGTSRDVDTSKEALLDPVILSSVHSQVSDLGVSSSGQLVHCARQDVVALRSLGLPPPPPPMDTNLKAGSAEENWVRNHPLYIKITQRGYPLPIGEKEILALRAYTPQEFGGEAQADCW